MLATLELNGLQLDALLEMANIASGHAATALGQLTDRRIMITTPNFSVVPAAQISAVLGYGHRRVVVIAMDLLGEATGTLAFLMPEDNARELGSLLLRRPAADQAFDALTRSSLTETANILGGAYTGVMASLTGALVMLSVPTFGIEPPDSVLARCGSGATVEQLALCIETTLTCDGNTAVFGGHMLLLPEEGSVRSLLDAMRLRH